MMYKGQGLQIYMSCEFMNLLNTFAMKTSIFVENAHD